jgi:hypothetical protein
MRSKASFVCFTISAASRRIRYVALGCECAHAQCFNLAFQRLGSFGAFRVIEGDVSTAPGQFQRDRPANAARGAGDDADLPANCFSVSLMIFGSSNSP